MIYIVICDDEKHMCDYIRDFSIRFFPEKEQGDSPSDIYRR